MGVSMELKQLWVFCVVSFAMFIYAEGRTISLSDISNFMEESARNAKRYTYEVLNPPHDDEEERFAYEIYNAAEEGIDDAKQFLESIAQAASEDYPKKRDVDSSISNDISDEIGVIDENEGFQESDLTDLADLEVILNRERNSNCKVVLSRGTPQLKINGSFVETNEGSRKLLNFIVKSKQYAGRAGYNSTNPVESEGIATRQMELRRPDGIVKKVNRYEISYWHYKFQEGLPIQDIMEKYEVNVMCQPSPPGHTLFVNHAAIAANSGIWQLTVNEACRFWRS